MEFFQRPPSPPPYIKNIFSLDLDESQEWPKIFQKPWKSADPRKSGMPAVDVWCVTYDVWHSMRDVRRVTYDGPRRVVNSECESSMWCYEVLPFIMCQNPYYMYFNTFKSIIIYWMSLLNTVNVDIFALYLFLCSSRFSNRRENMYTAKMNFITPFRVRDSKSTNLNKRENCRFSQIPESLCTRKFLHSQ